MNKTERRKMQTRWYGMIDRCTNPKSISYRRYGGRGIAVCERWLSSFDAYLEDVGFPPSPELSIDRIDNDGNYEPSNVRWATRSQQAQNSNCGRPMKYGNEYCARMTFSIPSDLRDRLVRASKQTGLSVSAIVVAGLRAILSQTPDRLREQIGG
jgi:hypothetical protein